jgi:cystathionine beta-lyase/cystathionine gamma-synthase
MVAFSLSTDEQALKFMRKLKIIREASSLGGVESVISMPMNTSHARLSELELRSAGITPGTLRLSVGIEDVADLIDDITQGLN